MKAQDEQRFIGEQRAVLCLLAVGGEPVTVSQLAAWSRLDMARIRRVVNEWLEFLTPVAGGNDTRYRLYHFSFAGFLSEEEDLAYYHRQIASAALARLGIPDLR